MYSKLHASPSQQGVLQSLFSPAQATHVPVEHTRPEQQSLVVPQPLPSVLQTTSALQVTPLPHT